MLKETVFNEEIKNYLKQNEVINLNILGILESTKDPLIYTDELLRGVLVRLGYFNYIYTESDEFLDEVLTTLFTDGEYGFSGVYTPLANKIKERFDVEWDNPCDLYVLELEDLDLSLKRNNTQSVRLEDAKVVDEFYTYRHEDSLNEILSDVLHRPSSAVYIDGEIASWVLTHPDYSMGIMYTKEEYRKKGYAVDVTVDLAHQLIQLGKKPYLQIVKGNDMSTPLALKCNFKKVNECCWFGINVK